jgi:hypothetical protein
MNTILDHELGEAKTSGDFLVREAPREERHELLLPRGQAKLHAKALIQDHGTFARRAPRIEKDDDRAREGKLPRSQPHGAPQ